MSYERYGMHGYYRSGIQMRRNSWQDGVLGTNCPIPPKWNWTYQFQVKDQIGSFFYFPSLNLQRASGGFGSFVLNNRVIIPIPFAQPDGDIVIIIGDWFTQNHTVSICSFVNFDVKNDRKSELNCTSNFVSVLGIEEILRCWKRPWCSRWSSHQWKRAIPLQ